ncbi:MAG: zinc ABC transporter substrate-binding protein [Clostridia bacterium]|nr:zinc ABC transporter substrate-binding protein [Clostridia bacterium]
MRIFKILLVFCLVLALCACGANASEAGKKLSIVCTNFPCYDFARAVAGDNAELRLLIKPGAEVHSYEPTPADIMAIAECDLFIYIGGESDAWVEDILATFGSDAPESLRMFDCVEAIEGDHGHEHDHHDAAEYDEHIWTSPVNAVRMVEALAAKLSEIDGAKAAAWQENAGAYCAEIEKIDAQFRDIVSTAARTEMIFADRFPFIYFAREYGLDYVSAFPSCAAESEPSARTMMELIDRVAKDKVPAVYTIELSSGKTAQTIAEETGAKILSFHSIQNVSEADFSAGETYLTLMERNIEALKEGLN